MGYFKITCLILIAMMNAACVDTRYVEDREWQSMSIEERVLNERRNECAIRNDGTCMIYNDD